MDSIKNLKNFWSSKKVFITGHTGFKGSWLSIILNSLNSEIHGYSLKPQKNSLYNKSKIEKKISSSLINNFVPNNCLDTVCLAIGTPNI